MSNIIPDIPYSEEDREVLLKWNQWNPGLDNDHRTMQEVIDTLPAAPPSAIPEEIKILENPDSPWAFPGAINLERHDCVHVLVGRGLLPQDEAFVIGYTMGAAKTVTDWQYSMFRCLAVNWYPAPYNFSEDDLYAFDLGFARGSESKVKDLQTFPFEKFMDYTVGELRKRLGVNVHALHAAYKKEKMYLPHSKASMRLDTHWKSLDPSSIHVPDGICIKDDIVK